MFYLLYLAGMSLALTLLCSLSYDAVTSAVTISLSQTANFWDPLTLLFLLLCVFLALLATRSVREFGGAFAWMLRPRPLSAVQREERLQALETALRAGAAAGGVCVLAAAVNLLHGMTLSMDDGIGLHMGVALLPAFYALALDLLLLPIRAALRGQRGPEDAMAAPVRRRK